MVQVNNIMHYLVRATYFNSINELNFSPGQQNIRNNYNTILIILASVHDCVGYNYYGCEYLCSACVCMCVCVCTCMHACVCVCACACTLFACNCA